LSRSCLHANVKYKLKNNPHFHLAEELQRITGVDLTRIHGADVIVAQTVIGEMGLDMSPWKTEAHSASWLGLCPEDRISGDKVLARGTRRLLNHAATALRLGASTLLAKPDLSRRAVPTLAYQARRS
jgi:transposase